MKQYKEKEKSQKAVNAQATKSTKECAGEIYLLDYQYTPNSHKEAQSRQIFNAVQAYFCTYIVWCQLTPLYVC